MLPERVELVLEGVAVEVEVSVFLVDHLENAQILEDLCLMQLLMGPLPYSVCMQWMEAPHQYYQVRQASHSHIEHLS